MRLRLGLIGKNISHSKSPEIYRSLLSFPFTYEIIDCVDESQIPTIEKIEVKFDGINITSPYKEHFLNKVELDDSSVRTNAINCLYRKNGVWFGTNTDFIALKHLIPKMVNLNKWNKIVILGDGVMARIVKSILSTMTCEYLNLTRSTHGDLSFFNIESIGEKNLVINCCSRSFEFRGKIDQSDIFWDLNYSHTNGEYLTEKCRYIDGEELLFEQAKVATCFWLFGGDKKN